MADSRGSELTTICSDAALLDEFRPVIDNRRGDVLVVRRNCAHRGRSAANVQGKLAAPSPLIGAKGYQLQLSAVTDCRYFLSAPIRSLPVTTKYAESPEDDSVFEVPPVCLDLIPPHQRLLRHV